MKKEHLLKVLSKSIDAITDVVDGDSKRYPQLVTANRELAKAYERLRKDDLELRKKPAPKRRMSHFDKMVAVSAVLKG